MMLVLFYFGPVFDSVPGLSQSSFQTQGQITSEKKKKKNLRIHLPHTKQQDR